MQSAITALRNHPYLFLLTPHSLHHRALAAWHHLPNLSPPLSAAPIPPPPSIPFSYPGVNQKAEPITPSPATAHPPVYTNHRSRSLSNPAGKPRPCPHQHQGSARNADTPPPLRITRTPQHLFFCYPPIPSSEPPYRGECITPPSPLLLPTLTPLPVNQKPLRSSSSSLPALASLLLLPGGKPPNPRFPLFLCYHRPHLLACDHPPAHHPNQPPLALAAALRGGGGSVS